MSETMKAAFNFAPLAASWRQMVRAVAPRARLILISLPAEALCFDAAKIIERGLQVTGSADGTRQELMRRHSPDREAKTLTIHYSRGWWR